MQQETHRAGDVIASKYVVERLLGRGGMGAVYVVSHQLTGKKLALKVLLPEHTADSELATRFLREAQAAGRIQHRHVVDVFDVGQDGDLLYMVMPLLEGKPLSELLKAGALGVEEVLGIAIRAMEGVGVAHAQGIVHRDLKPDNIFVCVGPSGRYDDPRVLDFGISKRDDDMSQPLTRSGVMMGTPHYMSFEQINSQRDLDQRVDVYAMGVILYEALSGSPPHMAESVGQLAIRMMSTAPAHLDDLRPDLPPGLGDVVMTAIARDREDRYPTMEAFLEALRPYHPQRPSSFAPEGAAPRVSFAPAFKSNDAATVKVQVPEASRDSARVRNPIPTPPGMLRAARDEKAPPRIIAASGKLLSRISLLLLLGGAAAGVAWVVNLKTKPQARVATPVPAPAAPAQPEVPATPPPAAHTGGEGEPAAVAKADAPTPKKKRKRRRRHSRHAGAGATAAAATPHKNVVLFVDSDGGVWEEDEEEVEGEGEPVEDDTGAPVPTSGSNTPAPEAAVPAPAPAPTK